MQLQTLMTCQDEVKFAEIMANFLNKLQNHNEPNLRILGKYFSDYYALDQLSGHIATENNVA